MAFYNDPLSLIIAERCTQTPQHTAKLPPQPTLQPQTAFPLDFAQNAEVPLDIDFSMDFLESADSFDFSGLLDLQPEELLKDEALDNMITHKRKLSDSENGDSQLKNSKQCVAGSSDSDSITSHCLAGLETFEPERPQYPRDGYSRQDSRFSECSIETLSTQHYDSSDLPRPTSPCSDMSEQSFCERSVEHHFQKIEEHVKLAIGALRKGQYERNKSIVTWAHELKNRTFSEVRLQDPCSTSLHFLP